MTKLTGDIINEAYNQREDEYSELERQIKELEQKQFELRNEIGKPALALKRQWISELTDYLVTRLNTSRPVSKSDTLTEIFLSDPKMEKVSFHVVKAHKYLNETTYFIRTSDYKKSIEGEIPNDFTPQEAGKLIMKDLVEFRNKI